MGSFGVPELGCQQETTMGSFGALRRSSLVDERRVPRHGVTARETGDLDLNDLKGDVGIWIRAQPAAQSVACRVLGWEELIFEEGPFDVVVAFSQAQTTRRHVRGDVRGHR